MISTVGELTGDHIGQLVTVSTGGCEVTGRLVAVYHEAEVVMDMTAGGESHALFPVTGYVRVTIEGWDSPELRPNTPCHVKGD